MSEFNQKPKSRSIPSHNQQLGKAVKWLDFHVLSSESRHPLITVLYMVFALIMLLHHVYVTLFFPASGYQFFGTSWIIFAVLGILLGKMWKDTTARILFLIWLGCYLRLRIFNPELLSSGIPVLTSGFFAAGGVYSVSRVLKKKQQKLFLQVFCLLWTLFALVLSVLGVYSAYTGTAVPNLSTGVINVFGGRLYLYYYCVTSGTLVSVSAVIALWGLTLFRPHWMKAFLIISSFIMIVANALTGTRTGFIISSSGIAALLCLSAYRHFLPSFSQKTSMRKIILALSVFAGFVLITGVLAYSQTFLNDGFTAIRNRGGLLIGQAYAEGAAPSLPGINNRDFSQINDLNGMTSGRIAIWQAVIADITSSNTVLFLGRSLVNPMGQINTPAWHSHNLLLQITLECGLPGLLAALLVLGLVIRKSHDTLHCASAPAWQWMSIGPLLALFIGEMAECTTTWNYQLPQMTILYFFCGLVVSFGSLSHALMKESPLDSTQQSK